MIERATMTIEEGRSMRGYLAGGLFIVAAAAVSINPAAAASACTGWIDFPGTTRECLDFVLERTRQAGFKPAPSGDTVFFWFGNNVVRPAASPRRTCWQCRPTIRATTAPARCKTGSGKSWKTIA